MKKIVVRSQEELDRIVKTTPVCIEIAFGNKQEPAILRGSHQCAAIISGAFYVAAYGSVRISAFNGSHVSAYEDVMVLASFNSHIEACGHMLVHAAYGSQVRATQSCTVIAYDESWIDAEGQSSIIAHPNANITLANNFCGRRSYDLTEFRRSAASFSAQWLGKNSA